MCLYGQFLSDLLAHLDKRPPRSCLNHFCVLPTFLDSSRIMFRLTEMPGGTFPFTKHRNARLYADHGKWCTNVNRYFNSHPPPTRVLTTVNVAWSLIMDLALPEWHQAATIIMLSYWSTVFERCFEYFTTYVVTKNLYIRRWARGTFAPPPLHDPSKPTFSVFPLSQAYVSQC